MAENTQNTGDSSQQQQQQQQPAKMSKRAGGVSSATLNTDDNQSSDQGTGAAGDSNQSAGDNNQATGGTGGNNTDGNQAAGGTGGAAGDTKDTPAGGDAGKGGSSQPDEVTQAILKKLFGDDFNGDLDAARERISAAKKDEPLTEEQKKEQERQMENRLLDFFVNVHKGTAEDFVAMKQVASADLTQLSEKQLELFLKEDGFDDEEIKLLKKERYYQLEEADLEKYTDEKEKEFAKKKIEFGKKRLEAIGKKVKEKAEGSLNNLKSQLEALDLLEQKEKDFASKVDAHLSTLPQAVTIELGLSEDVKLDPIKYEVPADVKEEIAKTLKDPKLRNQYLFHPDNTLNIEQISELMLKAKAFDRAVKVGYLEGADREVKKFQKVFPNSPHAVGIGGVGANRTNNGKEGRFVKRGEVGFARRK